VFLLVLGVMLGATLSFALDMLARLLMWPVRWWDRWRWRRRKGKVVRGAFDQLLGPGLQREWRNSYNEKPNDPD
jgi:hypothetical protein